MEPPGNSCIGMEKAEQTALVAMPRTNLADLALQSASDVAGCQI